MRQALNSNPVVQIGVIGALVLVVGLFFMMNMRKKDSGSSSSSAATPATAISPAPGTTSPTTVSPDGGASVDVGSAGSASTLPVPSTGTVPPEALIPGPGLPAPVVKAWKSGDTVVLLIVRGGGIDDRLVKGSVRSLSRSPGTAVFVARAKDVSRYSRITQGVGVDRAPALVVVRPRKATGAVPEAQVSYGFRNSQSVVQAVHDAVYSGPDGLPYYPK